MTARPYLGASSSKVWPPARMLPASATLSAPPRYISIITSVARLGGKAAMLSAKSTSPPIA